MAAVAAAPAAATVLSVRVRHYNPSIDTAAVEALELLCETGPSGSISLHADLLGDPLGRVRHFPAYAMLIAESDGGEIVGMIRAGIKEMVVGRRQRQQQRRAKNMAIVAKAAYILGLRVAPSKRRLGIAMKLAGAIEAWCREQGATIAYMATEKSNAPSLRLFVDRLGFTVARTPSLLVHPVYQHDESLPRCARVSSPLLPSAAASLYRSLFASLDFFPVDIDAIVASDHCDGTFVATLANEGGDVATLLSRGGDGAKVMSAAFSSWAVLSIWRFDRISKLRLVGVPWRLRAVAAASRWIDAALPWLRLASFPDLFRPFGVDFMFGIHGEGQRSRELVAALCRYARNLARRHGCAAVAAELGAGDPLVAAVPHWKKLSCFDDLWCVKQLVPLSQLKDDGDYDENLLSASLGAPIFVDPRDV